MGGIREKTITVSAFAFRDTACAEHRECADL